MSTIPDNPFDATKPETAPSVPTTADQRAQHASGNSAFAAAKSDIEKLEPYDVLTGKGQLIGHSGTAPVQVPAAPANNQVPTSDSSEPSGIKWNDAQFFSPTQATGDLIVRDGTADARLPPSSTAGLALLSGGAATLPLYDKLKNAGLDDMPANTVKLRVATGGVPTDSEISALADHPSPTTGDKLLGQKAGGDLVSIDIASLPSGGGGGGISKGTPFVVGDVLEVQSDAGDGTARSTATVARTNAANTFVTGQVIAGSDPATLDLFRTSQIAEAGRFKLESSSGFLTISSRDDSGALVGSTMFTIAHASNIAGQGVVVGSGPFDKGVGTLSAENGIFDLSGGLARRDENNTFGPRSGFVFDLYHSTDNVAAFSLRSDAAAVNQRVGGLVMQTDGNLSIARNNDAGGNISNFQIGPAGEVRTLDSLAMPSNAGEINSTGLFINGVPVGSGGGVQPNFIRGLDLVNPTTTTIQALPGEVQIDGTTHTAAAAITTVTGDALAADSLFYVYVKDNAGNLELELDRRVSASDDPVYNTTQQYWAHPGGGTPDTARRCIGYFLTTSAALICGFTSAENPNSANTRSVHMHLQATALTRVINAFESTTWTQFAVTSAVPPFAIQAFVRFLLQNYGAGVTQARASVSVGPGPPIGNPDSPDGQLEIRAEPLDAGGVSVLNYYVTVGGNDPWWAYRSDFGGSIRMYCDVMGTGFTI